MIRYDELRQTLQLSNELRELPRGSDAQRMHLLDGLCALVDAQVGLWCTGEVEGGTVLLRSAIERGWAGTRERAAFLQFFEADQLHNPDPSMVPLAQRPDAMRSTMMRDQLVDDRGWYNTAHVQELRRAARIDSFIYSAIPKGDGVLCIAIHRPWGAKQFSEHERMLVEIFHQHSRWLHETPVRAVSPILLRGLAPRLAAVLQALARGLSEKQVAAELGLSPHTIHQYVKMIHRHFGVSSRGELLALCLGA